MIASGDGPFLIVGLGNPGAKYSGTRHNIGFELLDLLAGKWNISFGSKFQGQFGEFTFQGRRVLLLKPFTYMNLSGDSVQAAVHFYKVPVETQLVVVSDDLDLPVAALRLRKKGGPGGHNGLKSIIERLGTEAFPRIRIGIGRSREIPAESYVLGKIPQSERSGFDQALVAAAASVETVLSLGFDAAMNRHNPKRTKEEVKDES